MLRVLDVGLGSKDPEMIFNGTGESTGDLGGCERASYGDSDDADEHKGDKKARCDPF